VVPPSSLPREAFTNTGREADEAEEVARTSKGGSLATIPALPSRALVLQIVPHHNGEVFLSKKAVNQNPTFFGYPFTGKTVSKKSSNSSYPQRIPDPLVNITVYNSGGQPVPYLSREFFQLNMVYYEAKSEIRITLNSEHVQEIPSHSILVMSQPEEEARYDYELQIYCPGSDLFNMYLDVCNQTLPSGGAKTPRKMGWL
jgi:hypothetical protein